MALLAPLLALVQIASPASAPDEAVFDLNERVPITLLISSPSPEKGLVSQSDLLRILTSLFRSNTDFHADLHPPDVVLRCQGNLVCISLEAREDYNRESLRQSDGSHAPYSLHLQQLREMQVVYPRYLFLLSRIAVDDAPDRISVILLDTDRALRLHHEALREGAWEEEVATVVFQEAVLLQSDQISFANPEGAETLLTRLFQDELSLLLGNHFKPYGEIVIEADETGLVLQLDGQTIGTTRSGEARSIRLVGVHAGARTLTIQHRQFAPFETTVLVEPGKVARVVPVLEPKEEPAYRDGVIWGGAALSLVGAALVVVAVARQDGTVATSCFVSPGTECYDGSAFQAIDYESDRKNNRFRACTPRTTCRKSRAPDGE